MRLKAISKNLLGKLFGTRAAAIYMLLFAISIGTATFIENDYGTSSAQKIVYQSWWFELLLTFFAITLGYNIIKFRFIQRKKWALLIFHTAMIIILIGAGITRYFGSEGVMHIREGDTSDIILSSETYLQFKAIGDNSEYEFDEQVLFGSLGYNDFAEDYAIGDHLVKVALRKLIPNPTQELVESAEGIPTLKVVVAGDNGREEHFIHQGETKKIGFQRFSFREEFDPEAINLYWRNDSLLINPNTTLTQMEMATRDLDTIYGGIGTYPLKLRSLYSNGNANFVFPEFLPSAKVEIRSEKKKIESNSRIALDFDITIDGEKYNRVVYGMKGVQGPPNIINSDGIKLSISYGARPVVLPFQLMLYDFVMERYPGTNSAASYASEVQLIDHEQDVHRDFRIYMNNILNYRGYRFFQSSFDRDEKGTYLSVNHDFWGTWISYFGYALLTIGLLMVLISKNTRFHQLSKSLKKMRMKSKTPIMVLLLLSSSLTANAQKNIPQNLNAVSEAHAEKFSTVVVQDIRGRMKPMHTLSRELMRKIYRHENFNGLSADQVILSMYAIPQEWYNVPIIKISGDKKIQSLLKINGDYASYKDFFDEKGSYKLSDEVQKAFEVNDADKNTYEKNLIKIDERVNIMNMIFTGSILKVLPVPGNTNNTWISSHASIEHSSFGPVADNFFSTYKTALHEAIHSNNYDQANKLLIDLAEFQKQNGSDVMPSKTKVSAEIFLNKLQVFNRLAIFYFLLGFSFLILLFVSVFIPDLSLRKIHLVLFGLVLLGFAFHLLGLGLRWYVSGRAPWSNGYESMIYIAFTTTLAGIIFTRKSQGGLAATMILSGVILLIAYLSYLDPEITPLVPVLKSYWLTIHVSLIAGSYGFLMLGAVIGLINLMLYAVAGNKTKIRIQRIVREMTSVSEMTLTGGLVMLSIGTFLGGVWANESWGRYWGWDAKETWALVSILVYAFILHMRLIPGIYNLFTFNLATLFGLASVIMTYFGVNYYLSGLHSYAAGDPVPIPAWVYISVASLIVISTTAYWKKRKFGL